MASRVALLLTPLLGTCFANFTNPFKDLVEGGKFEVTWDELPGDSLPAYISGRVFNTTGDGVTSFQENISSECPGHALASNGRYRSHGDSSIVLYRKRLGDLLSLAPSGRRAGTRRVANINSKPPGTVLHMVRRTLSAPIHQHRPLRDRAHPP